MMPLKKLLVSKFPLKVVIDTDVLYSLTLREILIMAATNGFFAPRWSIYILKELKKNLTELQINDQGETFSIMSLEEATALCVDLNKRFKMAMVKDYGQYLKGVHNNIKDRHVVTVAIKCRAPIIVTANVKHYIGIPDIVQAVSIDEFLCALLDYRPVDFLLILLNQVGGEHKPNTFEELLENRLKSGKNPQIQVKVMEAIANCSSPLILQHPALPETLRKSQSLLITQNPVH
jgi:predicted nucleic acid-binding protein